MSNNEMNISNNENVVMNNGNNIEEKKEELQLLGLEPQSAAGLAVGAVAQNNAAVPLVAGPLAAPHLVRTPSAGGKRYRKRKSRKKRKTKKKTRRRKKSTHKHKRNRKKRRRTKKR